MSSRFLSLFGAVVCFVACNTYAATYYVSLNGNDSNDGTTSSSAWKTVAKVNGAKFQAGDSILFERGGEWRESLTASSDGAEGKPITYDAYGTGAKPIFWGSDILWNKDFKPAGEKTYTYAIDKEVAPHALLVDHIFTNNIWAPGTITYISESDPRTDGKLYTGCVRGNVIFSNRKNHLIFRNLVVDETAGQLNDGVNQGYGIRIEGSSDVLLEDCEAYRCGRHNIAVINSTGFVGRRCNAQYAMPTADNTIYVTYSGAEASFDKCTSLWAECGDNPPSNAKDCPRGMFFVSHGDKQGLIVFSNITSRTKVSTMSAPAMMLGGTLMENGSYEIWGPKTIVDGVTLKDSAAIDVWASECVVQNCVADMTPTGGGPTGYGTALLARDKAKNNTFRYNTLITKGFRGVRIGKEAPTQMYGNIFVCDGDAFQSEINPPTAADLTLCDLNFYSANATFNGKTFADWQALGFDKGSTNGNPQFAGATDYHLMAGSPCVDAGTNVTGIAADHDGTARPSGAKMDIGAYEAKK
jgi:hypothetical protein